MKKLFSVIVAALMLTAALSSVEAHAYESMTVEGKSNYCRGVILEGIEPGFDADVTFAAPEDCTVVKLRIGVKYDKSKLELVNIHSASFDLRERDESPRRRLRRVRCNRRIRQILRLPAESGK